MINEEAYPVVPVRIKLICDACVLKLFFYAKSHLLKVVRGHYGFRILKFKHCIFYVGGISCFQILLHSIYTLLNFFVHLSL
jgi:hypothetical protein